MTKTDYPYRHRYPIPIIKICVTLHNSMPSRLVSLNVFLLFRVKVTYKTICEWTKKFTTSYAPATTYAPDQILICHADEKFVKVRGIWHYWWSIKDFLGNLIHKIITPLRDTASAKKLFTEGRKKLRRDVDIIVRDGLTAYDKAVRCLGKKCRSVVAGIKGKGVIHNKHLYWLSNNPIESLNSEIDTYLKRFQNNFANLESANRFANNFIVQKYLKKCFNEKKLSEAISCFEQTLNL
jgi:transposase-like protein